MLDNQQTYIEREREKERVLWESYQEEPECPWVDDDDDDENWRPQNENEVGISR